MRICAVIGFRKSIINEPTNTSLKNLELKDNSPKENNAKEDETSRQQSNDEIRFDFDRDIPTTSWQRPDSMTIPIGGVWHPGQSDDEDEFMSSSLD